MTVLPEADEVEVDIDPSDLKIDVYRSTGPGGQSVNTTDSAVRITHLPPGIVVAMQDEKSQIQNRAKAMKVLRARLLKVEQDRQAAEQSEQRRSQVGGGGRSEKIRTYNFKENRVTDHRIKLTLHKLDRVLMGDLDELVDALMADKRDRQLDEGVTAPDGDPVRPMACLGGDAIADRGWARWPRPRGSSSTCRCDTVVAAATARSGGPARAPASRCSTCSDTGRSGRSSSRSTPGSSSPGPRPSRWWRWRWPSWPDLRDPDADPGSRRGPHRCASTSGPARAPSPCRWPPRAAPSPGLEVWATDVSADALAVAGENLDALAPADPMAARPGAAGRRVVVRRPARPTWPAGST